LIRRAAIAVRAKRTVLTRRSPPPRLRPQVGEVRFPPLVAPPTGSHMFRLPVASSGRSNLLRNTKENLPYLLSIRKEVPCRVVKKADISSMPCPMARAIEAVGDGWSLLLIRDSLVFGATASRNFREPGNPHERPHRPATPSSWNEHLCGGGRLQRGNSLHEYRLTPKARSCGRPWAGLLEWGNAGTPMSRCVPSSSCTPNAATTGQPSSCPNCGQPVEADQDLVSAPVPQGQRAGRKPAAPRAKPGKSRRQCDAA